MFKKNPVGKPVEELKPIKKIIEEEVDLCACGEPVARNLGQSDVCKNHIRAN